MREIIILMYSNPFDSAQLLWRNETSDSGDHLCAVSTRHLGLHDMQTFGSRLAGAWNKLSLEVINAKCLKSFRNIYYIKWVPNYFLC